VKFDFYWPFGQNERGSKKVGRMWIVIPKNGETKRGSEKITRHCRNYGAAMRISKVQLEIHF
jgi:hypothetical protein